MTEYEIREDQTLTVTRRLEAMAEESRCTCGKVKDHLPPCPVYYWQRAVFIAQDALNDKTAGRSAHWLRPKCP